MPSKIDDPLLQRCISVALEIYHLEEKLEALLEEYHQVNNQYPDLSEIEIKDYCCGGACGCDK